MNASRDITELVTMTHDAMRAGRALLQRFTPNELVQDAYRRMAEEGALTQDVLDVLSPYLPSDQATFERAVAAVVTDAIDPWLQDKIVIEFDETAWQELAVIDDDDLLSPDVFSYLPHPNPFLVFPEPIIASTRYDDRRHRVVGCFVYGARPADPSPFVRAKEVRICSTDDPRATGIVLHFAGFITGLDGVPIKHRAAWDQTVEIFDTVFTLIAPRFPRPVMTFGEVADIILDIYKNSDLHAMPMLPDDGESARETIEMMRQALAAIIYLCCKNADLEIREPNRRKNRKNRRGKDDKTIRPGKLVKAGFHLGAKLRRWRVEQAQGTHGALAPSGVRLKPHPRRSHFRRIRYGVGHSQLSQPRFIAATWVNAADRDLDVVTVRKAVAD